MFTSKSQREHEQALALVSMVKGIAEATANSKGRGAERMEAMAQVVAALGISVDTIDTVEIDWKVIDGEYCPTLKLKAKGSTVKEIVQVER